MASGPEDPEVLLFAEDPGAANYLQDLPAALDSRGRRARLHACGPALAWLRDRNVPCIPFRKEADAAAFLRENPASLLVAGTAENPDTPALHLIDAAKRAGLPTVGVVDGYCNAPLRFRGRSDAPLAHAPDWIVAADPATRAAFVSLGAPSERVADCGHPAFDRVLRERRRLEGEDLPALRARVFPGAPAGRPLVVFAAEISTGLHPIQYRRSAGYTLAGDGHSEGRTEIVLEELLRALDALGCAAHLVLRLHPKNTLEEFAAYRGRFGGVSAGGPAYDLLYAADLVVGMTSVVLAEAARLGVPTLSIVPRPEERDWLPSIAAGLVRCAGTREEIQHELSGLLAAAGSGSARSAGPPAADALDRVCDLLESLLAGGKARLPSSARPW